MTRRHWAARAALVALLLEVAAMTSEAGEPTRGWTRFGREEGLADEAVRALSVDGAGRLWAGLLDGGLAVLRDGSFEGFGRERMGTPHVRDLAWSAERGELWAATDEGAARLEGSTLDWRGADGLAPGAADLVRVVPDVAGRTYLVPLDGGTGVALLAWDGRGLVSLAWPAGRGPGRVLGVVPEPAAGGERGRAARALLVTEGAILRIGAAGLEPVPLEGTALWRPSAASRDEEAESRRVPAVYLQAVHAARDGRVWLVRHDGLVVLDAQGFGEVPVAGGALRMGPWVAEEPDGTLWFGSWSGALVRVGPEASPRAVPLELGAGEALDALHAGPGGGLWVATRGRRTGLLRVRGTPPTAQRVLSPSAPEAPISTNDLLEDGEGRLWLASDDGLYRFAEVQGQEAKGKRQK